MVLLLLGHSEFRFNNDLTTITSQFKYDLEEKDIGGCAENISAFYQ